MEGHERRLLVLYPERRAVQLIWILLGITCLSDYTPWRREQHLGLKRGVTEVMQGFRGIVIQFKSSCPTPMMTYLL